MSFSFEGSWGPPGVYTEVGTFENQFWWEKYLSTVWFGSILAGTARDNGNSGFETVLRPGLLLGQVTATKKLVQWAPAALDGSQRIFGVLGYSMKMQRLGSNIDRHYGVMVSGMLKSSKLIIPGNAALGIAGDALEHIIRAQLYPRFIMDDDIAGNTFGAWREVRAETGTTLTVTEAMNNTLFTNRGNAGNINFTLPASPKKGLRYGFYTVAAGTVTVTAGVANTMIAFNDVDADAIIYSTAGEIIGNFIEVIGDGTSWLVINHLAAESVTPTITT